jgi:hypothetical protein
VNWTALRWSLPALVLCACDRTASKRDPVARDLSRALAPTPNTADTAAQRRQTELEKCKYVYHDEQGLRECLVVRSGWAPQDAAREIAIYKAEIARAVDSLQHIQDSLSQASTLAAKRRAAASRAADSIRLTASFRPWVTCVRQVLRGDTLVTQGEMEATCGKHWPKSATIEQFYRWSIYKRPKDSPPLETWVLAPEPEPDDSGL